MQSALPLAAKVSAWVLLVAVLLYVALVGLIWSQERRFLFPASNLRASAADAGLAGFQDVAIDTPDGEHLVGWWQPPEPGRVVFLYLHGNGGSLLNRRGRVRALAEGGRGILIVSYRGYSGSTGQPSEAGLRTDARAIYAWLGRYDPARIVLYGESLGTGVAIRLATEERVGGIVLDSPFTSTADVAKTLFWYVPVTLLMQDQFRSIDRIAGIRAPLLVLHGERDGLIPIAQSKILFDAAPEPKRYVRLPGVDHVGVLENGGLAEVRLFADGIEAELRAP